MKALVLLVALTLAAPAQAQEVKGDLETFRNEQIAFWKPLAENTRLLLSFASSAGLPLSQLDDVLPLAAVDPAQIEQTLRSLTNEQLEDLKQQFDTVEGWQQLGSLFHAAIPPDIRTGLTAFAAGDRPFADTNDFAEALCGLVEGLGVASTLQSKQTFSAVAIGLYETAEAIAIPFDVACDASPCSIALFDLPIVGPLKVALCSVATVTRIASAISRALVDASSDCSTWSFYNGVQQRVDARLSTVAPLDSTGVRGSVGFNGENLHEKLEDRLDVVTTTRSTQDSVDGQRGGRPPSPAKSLRTVVDHTDLVRLPELERTIDETLDMAKKQGELMRDFRDLLIRMQIESDLVDNGRNFREALFQLPSTISGKKRAFCERDIIVPCLAPGPDFRKGTEDDVLDATLCPDDSKPAETCDMEIAICSRTRTATCAQDSDCPAGETCDQSSHPCNVTRDQECSFDEDCPIGRARQTCIEADRQRGYFELVREIVEEAIDMTGVAGEEIYKASSYLASADALAAGGDYKKAYTDLRLAYQSAARVRRGH